MNTFLTVPAGKCSVSKCDSCGPGKDRWRCIVGKASGIWGRNRRMERRGRAMDVEHWNGTGAVAIHSLTLITSNLLAFINHRYGYRRRRAPADAPCFGVPGAKGPLFWMIVWRKVNFGFLDYTCLIGVVKYILLYTLGSKSTQKKLWGLQFKKTSIIAVSFTT